MLLVNGCVKDEADHTIQYLLESALVAITWSHHLILMSCFAAVLRIRILLHAWASLDQALAAGQKLLFDFKYFGIQTSSARTISPPPPCNAVGTRCCFRFQAWCCALWTNVSALLSFFCSLYKGHCSRSPAVCLYVTLQAVLPCYF